jgi:cytochrome c biogenesis protein CcmG, thiol:disulfide interchange protein DsbE
MNGRTIRRVAYVALGALFVGGLYLGWTKRADFAPADVGSVAPDFAARTLAGERASLADYRGRVVLLNIWATWCPPCVEEMPALQRLHDQLEPDGFSVVAVSVDAAPGSVGVFGERGGDVQAFVDSFGLSFPVLHDPSGNIQRRYNTPGLPASIIIDRAGRIRQKVLGAREWDSPDNVARIRELLDD